MRESLRKAARGPKTAAVTRNAGSRIHGKRATNGLARSFRKARRGTGVEWIAIPTIFASNASAAHASRATSSTSERTETSACAANGNSPLTSTYTVAVPAARPARRSKR